MSEIQQITTASAQQTQWACPTCHGPVATSWLFCERCGTDFRVNRPNQLAAPVPLPRVPTAPAASLVVPHEPNLTLRERLLDHLPEMPRRPSFSFAGLLGGVLVLVLIGVAITVHLQTRSDLRRTESTLASTRQQLSGVQADLGVSQAGLASTKSELAEEQAKLGETQEGLDDANSKLNLQTDQIEDLKGCLGGVQAAFSYFLDNYYDSALNELYAVEASCDRAYALF